MFWSSQRLPSCTWMSSMRCMPSVKSESVVPSNAVREPAPGALKRIEYRTWVA